MPSGSDGDWNASMHKAHLRVEKITFHEATDLQLAMDLSKHTVVIPRTLVACGRVARYL